MEAVQHNKEFADKVGVAQEVGKEMTKDNVGEKSYKNLPESTGLFKKLKKKLKK